MRRVTTTIPTTVTAVALLLLPRPGLAQDFENVRIETTQVGPGIHMLEGSGGNIGVAAGPDGVFLVDDQFAPLTPKIIAAIREFSDRPIRFVINTHWHADHTGGNENMGEAGAIIVAHENVRERMSVDQFIEAFDRTVPASPEAALPIVTFDRSVTFHLNGEEIHVFHVRNAHTDGDAVIHFRGANVVHMGDTYFNGSYPFIDVDSEGSIDGMIEAASLVLDFIDDATVIIPGHGPLSNHAELHAYREMLIGVRDRVAREIAAGKSREDVIAAKPTAEFDPEWGGGFLKSDDFTNLVYMDLIRSTER